MNTSHTAPLRWPGPFLALAGAALLCTVMCAATPPPRAAPRALPRAVRPDTAPTADSIVAFGLQDQFGHHHNAADYRGRALLLVAAARGGRGTGTSWVEMLRGLQAGAGATAVPVVAVADLRGIPRLLRRFTRGQFPDDPRQPVLLDWDGALARRLAFDRDRCTVLVVDPDGRVRSRMTPTTVDTLVARALLRDGAERSLTASTGR